MSDTNLPESNCHDEGKTCFSCNKSFSKRRGLLLHISVVHDKKKDFICEICKHSFGDKANMKKRTVWININLEFMKESKNITVLFVIIITHHTKD